jgi:hypothetical protein
MSETVLPPYSSSTNPSFLARGATFHPSMVHNIDQANDSQCGGRRTFKRRKMRSKRTFRCKKLKRGKKYFYTGRRKTRNKRCKR